MEIQNLNNEDEITTEDIIIDECLTPVMSKGEIIELINQSLGNPWTIIELADGKEIDLFPEWKFIIDDVIQEYNRVGWKVWHYLKGKREYISFENPSKTKKGK